MVFRANKELAQRALAFQRTLMAKKYDVDNDMEVPPDRELGYWRIKYERLPPDKGIYDAYLAARRFCQAAGSHPNDTAILGFTISALRQLDCCYRLMSGEKTTTMFEPEELRRIVLLRDNADPSIVRDGLNLLRGSRVGDDNGRINLLVDLWVLSDLIEETKAELLRTRMCHLLSKGKVSPDQFESWRKRAVAVLKDGGSKEANGLSICTHVQASACERD